MSDDIADPTPTPVATSPITSALGMRPSLKLLLVDDHPLWREGVASVLRHLPMARRIDIVPAASGVQALELLLQHADVAAVLLDLNLPRMDGLATLKALQQQAPNIPVLMLSASESPDDVRRCMAAGALGYLPKAADEVQLAAALSMVLAGCAYVPPLMLSALPGSDGSATANLPSVEPASRMTPRQLDVLRLLCEGKTNKQISQALDLSEKTTKAHVGAIFRALGVVNRTQAVLAAQLLSVSRDSKVS